VFVNSKVIIASQEQIIQGLNMEIGSLREILRLKNEVHAKDTNRIWELERECRLLQFKLDVYENQKKDVKNIEGASYG
jgi:hypothetical protein